MSERLSTVQIKFIDNHLKFLGIKFIDVRLELLDHLASEFENNKDDISLGDFIRTKKSFVRGFEKKLHAKRHWGYQRGLILRVFKFLYMPKCIVLTLLAALLFFEIAKSDYSTLQIVLFSGTLIIPQVLQFYIYSKPKGMHKKIQSFQYILSIMSLPSLFLYVFGAVSDWLMEDPLYFAMYWLLAFVFNLSGILEVIACKRKILSTYHHVLND